MIVVFTTHGTIIEFPEPLDAAEYIGDAADGGLVLLWTSTDGWGQNLVENATPPSGQALLDELWCRPEKVLEQFLIRRARRRARGEA